MKPTNIENQIKEVPFYFSKDYPRNSPKENWLEAERQILK